MEKLSEEQRKAIVAELAKCGFTEKGVDDCLREAGLLTPAETPYEKARRLNAIISVHSGPYANLLEDAADMADAYEQALAELKAEIDQRDREAWTDADMVAVVEWARDTENERPWAEKEFYDYLDDWIAARRAAKAKE
jgi:hypothetical protein